MQINKTNNQPAFGSKVTVTNAVKRTLCDYFNKGACDAFLKVVKELEGDGLSREYKIGQKTIDEHGHGVISNLFNLRAVNLVPRLNIQVKENISHGGERINIKVKEQSLFKTKAVSYESLKTMVETVKTKLEQFKKDARTKLDVKNIGTIKEVKQEPRMRIGSQYK